MAIPSALLIQIFSLIAITASISLPSNNALQLGKPMNGATDIRQMSDGTIIRFTDNSMFEITFPDGHKEIWNPEIPE